MIANNIRPKLTRIVSVVNHKGGVGKTTTVINLAAALSLFHKKVLIIDFDPQSNISQTLFNINDIEAGNTIVNLIEQDLAGRNDLTVSSVIRKYQNNPVNFDVMPSTMDLALTERKLNHTQISPEKFLKRILLRMEQEGLLYDFIFIDLPPSLNILVTNALCTSDSNELIIPLDTDAFSKQGLRGLFQLLAEIKVGCGITPKSYRFLFNKYDDRRIEDRAIRKEIEEENPGMVFDTIIRQCTALKTGHSYGDTIFNQEPRSNGAHDYINLAKEILGV